MMSDGRHRYIRHDAQPSCTGLPTILPSSSEIIAQTKAMSLMDMRCAMLQYARGALQYSSAGSAVFMRRARRADAAAKDLLPARQPHAD